MEKKRITQILTFLIFAGIIFFLFNVFFLFLYNNTGIVGKKNIISTIPQIIFGILVILFSVIFSKKAYQLIIGLILSSFAIVNLLIYFCIPYSFFQIWPLYGIIAAISLLISGFFKYKKPKIGYFMFSFTIIIMALICFLFSFKIIKTPFRSIIIPFGFIFFSLVAISLIIFFFFQQKHRNLMIKENGKENFEDEHIDFLNNEE